MLYKVYYNTQSERTYPDGPFERTDIKITDRVAYVEADNINGISNKIANFCRSSDIFKIEGIASGVFR